jgi:hypothetical protein
MRIDEILDLMDALLASEPTPAKQLAGLVGDLRAIQADPVASRYTAGFRDGVNAAVSRTLAVAEVREGSRGSHRAGMVTTAIRNLALTLAEVGPPGLGEELALTGYTALWFAQSFGANLQVLSDPREGAPPSAWIERLLREAPYRIRLVVPLARLGPRLRLLKRRADGASDRELSELCRAAMAGDRHAVRVCLARLMDDDARAQ